MAECYSATRVLLSNGSVRPVRNAGKKAKWGRLMDAHHYLGLKGLIGGELRHGAETHDGRWLALDGWCSGAFNVKARDACA